MDSHRHVLPPTDPEQISLKVKQIRRLISELPQELQECFSVNLPENFSGSLKRKSDIRDGEENAGVLVAASPSPKKRKVEPTGLNAQDKVAKTPSLLSQLREKKPHPKPAPKPEFQPTAIRPSKVDSISTSFYQEGFPSSSSSRLTRDEDMAVIEDLEPCPKDFDAPSDDPIFEKLEPYSLINLSSRKLPHEDLQEFLTGRYFLSPSLLYSVARPGKTSNMDVPVPGDWVTIAVVAERGEVKVSQGFTNPSERLDEEEGDENKPSSSRKPIVARGPKKYVRITLVDFGHKSKSGTAAGDALLSMLLFESDSAAVAPKDPDGVVRGATIYRGGSGGAFEEFLPKLREGTVVALLNPRVMKPQQGKTAPGSSKPHPTANVLGVTPSTADCIKIIGYSKDLGMCTAKQRDGKPCRSWCDKRKAQVCEYHLNIAVKSKRSSRAEFSAGTSGMQTGPPGTRLAFASGRKQPAFDPTTKTGLLPSSSRGSIRSDSGGATYILPGAGVVSSADTTYVSQRKQKQERDKIRKTKEASERKDEDLLKKLLSKDQGTFGAKAVESARAHMKAKGKEKAVLDDIEDDEEASRKGKLKRGVYNPDMLKKLGFDPTLRPGEVQRQKRPDLANFAPPKGDRDFELGPRPGPRIKSGVIVPDAKKFALKRDDNDASSDLEFDDEDVDFSGKSRVAKPDDESTEQVEPQGGSDSDSDLEIEPPQIE